MASKKKNKDKDKEPGVTRRGFIKGAATTAAGAVILESGLVKTDAQSRAADDLDMGGTGVATDPDAAVQILEREGRTITVLGGQSGMSAKQVLAEAEIIAGDYGDCAGMAEAYQRIADGVGLDARQVADGDQLEKDREFLLSRFSPNYTFTDPFGVTGTRDTTVESILSGKIRKETFSYPEETIEILGDTAITTGVFAMEGSMKVKYIKSGAVRRRDISGRYRTTHTYQKRGDTWVLMSSHMSKEPSPKPFAHGHPGEPDLIQG